MSHKVNIGRDDAGHAVTLDISRLIVSRMLVTAASGGGKSWLLRKILEGVSKTTQTIVIDTEGEFATLRELRDMVLAGPAGEVPAEPRSASLLCRRLMELNLSAVIDVSELKPSDRRAFASSFCHTMVDLPRSLWRPCVVAIDETHEYAPEGDKSESTDAIALLGSKGRKRGYCLLGATQRLSKLAKDVAAELKNRFIGQMTLDVDLKRAADILGFNKDRWPEIRDLSPPGHEGEFFCFGPALNQRGVIKFRAGAVETTHPKAGQGRLAEPPSPSEKIKGVLTELKDLPQQAEAEIRDLAAAKQKIGALERELRAASAAVVSASAMPKNAPTPQELREAAARAKRDAATIDQLRRGLEQAMKVIAEINATGFEAAGIDPALVEKAVKSAADQIVKAASAAVSQRQAEFERLKKEANALLAKLQKLLSNEGVSVSVNVKHNEPFTVKPTANAPRRPASTATDVDGRAGLSPTERAVLDAAASFPGGATRQRISIFSGRSIKSSSFQAAFSGGEPNGERPSLVQRGLLRQVGDRYEVTEEGTPLAEATAGASLDDWLRKLLPSEAKVLKCLADHAGERLTRTRVSEITGQSEASSSFQGAFPALRDLGLIEGKEDFAVVDALAI